MTATTATLFVYGTLQRRGGNHGLLMGAEPLGPARTTRPFPLVISGLPFLIDAPGEGHLVYGELYRVNQQALNRIDRLEGHPTWYKRRKEAFQTPEGEEIPAWVYFITGERDLERLELFRNVEQFVSRPGSLGPKDDWLEGLWAQDTA